MNPALALNAAAAAQSTCEVCFIQPNALVPCVVARVIMNCIDFDKDVPYVALILTLFCSCLRVTKTHDL